MRFIPEIFVIRKGSSTRAVNKSQRSDLHEQYVSKVILKYSDCRYAAESSNPSTTGCGNDQIEKEKKERGRNP
jgi:hypothetical protein